MTKTNTQVLLEGKLKDDVLPDLAFSGELENNVSKGVLIPHTGATDRDDVFRDTLASWKALGFKVVLVVNESDKDAMAIVPKNQIIYYKTSCAPSSGVARIACFLLAWLWCEVSPDMQCAFGDDRRIVKLLGTTTDFFNELDDHFRRNALIVSPLSQRGATYKPQSYFAAQVYFFTSTTIKRIWKTIEANYLAVSAPVGGDYVLTSLLQDNYGNDSVQIVESAKRCTAASVTVNGRKKPIRSLVRDTTVLRKRLDKSERERISGVHVLRQLSSSMSPIAKYIWKQIEGKNDSFKTQRALKKYLLQ